MDILILFKHPEGKRISVEMIKRFQEESGCIVDTEDYTDSFGMVYGKHPESSSQFIFCGGVGVGSPSIKVNGFRPSTFTTLMVTNRVVEAFYAFMESEGFAVHFR